MNTLLIRLCNMYSTPRFFDRKNDLNGILCILSWTKISENPSVYAALQLLVLLYLMTLYGVQYLLLSYILLLFSTLKMCQKPSIYAGFRFFRFAQIKPRSIQKVRHYQGPYLGRVVVFVLCQYHTFCRNYEQNFQLFF